MSDVLTLIVAFVAVLVAAAVYLGESRRTDLEAARALHLDLTSGEVAEARRLLGTLRYGSPAERARVTTEDALTAYFTLLWCFERIAAGRRAMMSGRLLSRRGRAVRFLDESIRWHLIEWRDGLPLVKRRLGARMEVSIDDEQSRQSLKELLTGAGLGPMCDEQSEPAPSKVRSSRAAVTHSPPA